MESGDGQPRRTGRQVRPGPAAAERRRDDSRIQMGADTQAAAEGRHDVGRSGALTAFEQGSGALNDSFSGRVREQEVARTGAGRLLQESKQGVTMSAVGW